MARIVTGIKEKVYSITNWLGVNEAADGEATLKTGEASLMRNFKVTDGGALKKRSGSKDVAGLMAEYVKQISATEQTIKTEIRNSDFSFEVASEIAIDSVGNITLTPPTTTVTAANAAANVGKYFILNGNAYQFAGLTIQEG